MNGLKELLARECNYRFSMDSPPMAEFMDSLTEKHLKKGEILTRYGQIDTNIYIIQSGIMKLSYLEGDRENIFAFGLNGSLFTQMSCYYMNKPSFFQCEACTEAILLKIDKHEFDRMVDDYPLFAKWVLDRALDQLCSLEVRMRRINGSASERYLSLLEVMPEVVANVRAKDIASYLGVTPIYLSRLKKELGIPKMVSCDKKRDAVLARNSANL